MNEAQLKAVVRHTFTLRDTADRAVLDTDALLARVMRQIRLLVETLPEESLLVTKAWNAMSGLVKKELQVYTEALDRAIKREEVANRDEMVAYAVREGRYAGAKQERDAPLLTPTEVMAMTEATQLGKNTYKEVFTPRANGISPWTQHAFSSVDKAVRQGILEGLAPAVIAQRIAQMRQRRGITEVSVRGDTAARRVRGQSLAASRTASFDTADQIKKRIQPIVFPDTRDFGYEWFAQLDSVTCATCAGLSGRRSKDGETFIGGGKVPHIPVHVNCRCTLMLTGPAVVPVKRMPGQQVEAKGPETFSGDDFSDFLASSSKATQVEFFGGGPIGERRARYFRNQLKKGKLSAQQILQNMLTGPADNKHFIEVP